jgi:hypothetical protein
MGFSLTSWRPLTEWERQLVFIKGRFVVVESGPEAISKLVGLIKAYCTRTNQGTHLIRIETKQVKSVTLHQITREGAFRMPHDSSVGFVRINFDWLDPHFPISSMMPN